MKLAKSINRKIYPSHLFYGPQWLVLGVNNICNLHCKMCDVGTQSLNTNFAQNLVGTHPIDMPMELFQRIVDQTKKYYPSTKLGYAFTEPLIYKHLEESLRAAKKAQLFTAITTNALNLKQKAPMLIDSGLNELFISLDGPEKIHNEIRGHKSSYQRAIEGIEAISSNSSIPISVFCVITEWNIGFLKQFVDELAHFSLKHVGFLQSNYITQERADVHNQLYGNRLHATCSNIEEVNFEAFDLPKLFDELTEISNSKYPFPVTFHPKIESLEELENYYLHPEIHVGKTCLDVFNNIMIKSDSSVIPAHGRCYNVSIGNLYETDLNKIWNSENVTYLRKLITKNGGLLPACSRCCSAIK